MQFGTDYLYAAKLGGKVTQQTSAREDTSSSSQKADLAESSSASFGYNFMKLDTSSSSAQVSLHSAVKQLHHVIYSIQFAIVLYNRPVYTHLLFCANGRSRLARSVILGACRVTLLRTVKQRGSLHTKHDLKAANPVKTGWSGANQLPRSQVLFLSRLAAYRLW